MTEVEYRPFRDADAHAFLDLIDEAFGYGFLFPDQDVLQAFYMDSLAGLVLDSTFSEVAVSDDDVVGMCFCAAKFAPHAFKGFEPRMHALMAAERFRWMSESRDHSAIRHKREIDRTVSRIVSRIGGCDGDIQFLVVSRRAKGRGIGGRLLRDMLDHMREWGVRRVLVLTIPSDKRFQVHGACFDG